MSVSMIVRQRARPSCGAGERPDVKCRTVITGSSADLLSLYAWIADATSSDIALGYIDRLEAYVRGFDVTSER